MLPPFFRLVPPQPQIAQIFLPDSRQGILCSRKKEQNKAKKYAIELLKAESTNSL